MRRLLVSAVGFLLPGAAAFNQVDIRTDFQSEFNYQIGKVTQSSSWNDRPKTFVVDVDKFLNDPKVGKSVLSHSFPYKIVLFGAWRHARVGKDPIVAGWGLTKQEESLRALFALGVFASQNGSMLEVFVRRREEVDLSPPVLQLDLRGNQVVYWKFRLAPLDCIGEMYVLPTYNIDGAVRAATIHGIFAGATYAVLVNAELVDPSVNDLMRLATAVNGLTLVPLDATVDNKSYRLKRLKG